MQLLTKGKRGIIYLDSYKEKEVIVKKQNEKSTAINRIQNEISWLKKLNKYKIGPKLIWEKEDSFAMEYIQGILFEKYIKTHDWKKVSSQVLKQCRIMDKLKVNKLELQNPHKHIIIKDNKPILIDFERCKINLYPKNVTQFCQYLMKLNLVNDKNKIIKLLEDYKKDFSEDKFKKILKFI